jgi:hypothetical protein
MGRSWLFSWLGLEKTLMVYRIGGLLWLVGGVVLVAAGLGLSGWIVLIAWWRDLALAGGTISLFMLAIYLHPLTIIGTASSLAVIVSLLWTKWPAISMLP